MCNFVMCWSQEQVYKIFPTHFSTRKDLLTTGVKKKKKKCLRAFESLNVKAFQTGLTILLFCGMLGLFSCRIWYEDECSA